MRSWSCTAALAGSVAFASLLPGVARAEGTSIADATPVVYGQQEFGNTHNGTINADGVRSSWWSLSVTAGDNVVIDWEAPDYLHNEYPQLVVYPVGTTDFNYEKANGASDGLNANGHQETRITAQTTGVMPLAFESDEGCCDEHPGPYDFTATVQHAVILAVPTLSALPPSGTVSVGVHNPDGVPINDPSGLSVSFDVIASGSNSPTPVGSAPALNGTATIAYSIPSADDGHAVEIEASSSGAAYLPGSSATQTVRVETPALPPPPPHCVVPRAYRDESLTHVEQAISHNHCTVGVIRRVRSRHYRKGTVIAVSPRPSTHLSNRARVEIVVSQGR